MCRSCVGHERERASIILLHRLRQSSVLNKRQETRFVALSLRSSADAGMQPCRRQIFLRDSHSHSFFPLSLSLSFSLTWRLLTHQDAAHGHCCGAQACAGLAGRGSWVTVREIICCRDLLEVPAKRRRSPRSASPNDPHRSSWIVDFLEGKNGHLCAPA